MEENSVPPDQTQNGRLQHHHHHHHHHHPRRRGYRKSNDLSSFNRSNSTSNSSSSPSSSFKLSYSVNSQDEYDFVQKCLEKSGKSLTYVKQLTMKFEKLSGDGSLKYSPKFSVGIFPWTNLNSSNSSGKHQQSSPTREIPSEEEVEDISECEETFTTESNDMQQVQTPKMEIPSTPLTPVVMAPVPNIFVDEFEEDSNTDDCTDSNSYQSNNAPIQSSLIGVRLSEPPKRIVEAKNRHVILKSLSYHPSNKYKEANVTTDDINTPKIKRNKCQLSSSQLDLSSPDQKAFPPIIEELLKTEEAYVQNLKDGIKNYGDIFDSADIPDGLKGKKWLILGNVEQIAEFHETEFLPMVQRNFNDIKNLFDEFSKFIDVSVYETAQCCLAPGNNPKNEISVYNLHCENCFYMYVIYTMNKKISLKLCEEHRDYFRKLQELIGDKLGINSFLVQPIQRLARYPLIFEKFINTCFKSGDINYKPAIESCCKVEKRVRNLLTVVNESEELNDIEECHDIDIFYQGHFKKTNEFYVYDHSQRRGYRSKAFIFDKCLIYTEVKDKRLVFRGCYPSEYIGFVAKPKSFTLYYKKRKVQECDFSAEQNIIDNWVELIRDMIKLYALEEKRKLTEKYSKIHNIYRRPTSVTLFRNSSRISSDSGLGSINYSNMTTTEECSPSPRTTWYMENFTN